MVYLLHGGAKMSKGMNFKKFNNMQRNKPKTQKHTPGPWSVVHSIEANSEGIRIRAMKGWDLAEMRGPILIEEEFANATLIAAAPEMFDALKWLIKGLDKYDKFTNSEVQRGYRDAFKAIAKARGES